MTGPAPLPALSTIKLVMAIVGIGIFGLGVRWDAVGVRWAGIAVVAVAWLLRLSKRDRPADADRDESGGA